MDALVEVMELGPDAQIPEGRPYMGEKHAAAARARELEAKHARDAAEAAEAARKLAAAEIARLIAERDAAMDVAEAAKLAAAEEAARRAASVAESAAENAKLGEAAKAAATEAKLKVEAAEAEAKAELERVRANEEKKAAAAAAASAVNMSAEQLKAEAARKLAVCLSPFFLLGLPKTFSAKSVTAGMNFCNYCVLNDLMMLRFLLLLHSHVRCSIAHPLP